MTALWPSIDPSFAREIATRTPVRFRHGLAGHPLLTLEEIARLAEELPPASLSAEPAEKPIAAGDAADVAASTDDIGQRIRDVAANRSWFTLLHVHQVARYRALVDQVLDDLAEASGMDPKNLTRRMGFLFASSPKGVTAAHFDIEHSFCMQLQGTRTLGFGRFADEEEKAREVERYWNGSFGRFHEPPETVAEHVISPGTGCYIPPYTPHWIVNGEETSLSMTVTFMNRDNETESLVQAFNAKIARTGLTPHAFGDSPARDRAKAGAMKAWAAVRRPRGAAR
ncbi:hypothetical protein GGQ22_19465 [Nocardioides sp. zg-579]|uniref:Uncharacterized protein n=1 Tax=Nocardioides marmotae TaxID=2663857 RepID=A0A6I3JGH9_9ACTN|nr:cupin domain-containing protein [Nocardioides marmotae]MCR6033593.1 hypothetical protein [Gordonia jinghuaiqii]MTB97251.1 hypothetical protein [Nocardioides marmotae]QKE02165.1 hypothetical protein HPC71_14585 [Nocardioides marmotae]